MRYSKQSKMYRRTTARLFVFSGTMFIPFSSAQAATFDEVVSTVTSSSTLTFGVGAATGAILAGLMAILFHTFTSRRLKKQIAQLNEEVREAQEAQALAEARAEELRGALHVVPDDSDREDDYDGGDTVVIDFDRAMQEKEAKELQDEPKDQPEQIDDDSASVENKDSAVDAPESLEGTAHEEKQDVYEAEVVEFPEMPEESVPLEVDELSDDAETIESIADRTVRIVLDERLTPDAFDVIPGTTRRRPAGINEMPAFLGRRRSSVYDPMVRASIIDKRVPRFDESLFPDADALTHQSHGLDVFEAAMRAMEDTLQHTAVLGIEEDDTILLVNSKERPDIIDAAAYVDYLVQDEIEKTKNGEALPTSHAHLTMFEGTGDLNASKSLRRHSPRHMRVVSKDA